MQELLDKLEKAEAKLAQTELDLNSEQNVRRTLQAEVVEAKERETAMAQRQVRDRLSGTEVFVSHACVRHDDRLSSF